MPDDNTVDLTLIGTTLRRLVNEVATMRDDVAVISAILRRLDNGQDRLLDEVRAMHAQHARFDARLRALESAP